MKTASETPSLLNSYTGLDGRTLLTFVALVSGVLIVVTGIYVAIFGFQNWKRDMKQAGSMMVAGFKVPAGSPVGVRSAPSAMVPGASGVALGVGGVAPGASARVNRTVPGTAQYVCRGCGAVGLPDWSASGAPLCPNCGGIMGVVGRTGSHLHLAATP